MDRLQPYRTQIQMALRELVELGKKRKEIDRDMTKLRQLIRANADMLPDNEGAVFLEEAESSGERGFTDTIRQLLRANRDGFTPTELRNALTAAGFDLSSQSNAMASIHSVLKRLKKSREVVSVQELRNDDYETVYKWNFVKETAQHLATINTAVRRLSDEKSRT
jgi:hypothetical protein